MDADSVSVVVPAYNAERFLHECLDSILAQEHAPMEVLVVDDGSTDGTPDLLSSYGDPIRCIRQKNQGVSVARNRGLEECRGRLVAFCDADDVWEPVKLRVQVEHMARSRTAVAAFTGAREVDEALRRIGEIPCPPPDSVTFSDILWHRRGEIPPAVSSTLLASASVLSRIGGWDPALSDAADWDILLRLRRVGSFTGCCDPHVLYRVHGTSMSFRVPLRARDSRRLFQKLLSQGVDDRREISAAWGRQAMVMGASLFRAEGWLPAATWLLGEAFRSPGSVARGFIEWVRER